MVIDSGLNFKREVVKKVATSFFLSPSGLLKYIKYPNQ